ncbi:MAG: CD225/dispanin family protein [Bacteroidaceae bacterium]
MEYYILKNENKCGPFQLEELRMKDIDGETLVWRSGLTEWVKANTLEELKELLNCMPPPTIPPPSLPKTWLVESILVTCFCCLPLGIIGIINATKVESAFFMGNFEEARHASAQAKKWALWGLISSAIVAVLYVLFIICSIYVCAI